MKSLTEKTTKIIIKSIMIIILGFIIMNCGSCTTKQSFRYNKCGTKQAKQAKKHYNSIQYQ